MLKLIWVIIGWKRIKEMEKKNIKLTSEETFIEHYLMGQNIKYKKQVKIEGLKNDVKNHRVVDFYLPRLNIYIEYFGLYNSTKTIRDNYDKKAEVYIKNNIPTVFLYPHELGFLDYAFNNKLLKVLRVKKFKKKSFLIKYKLNRFYSKGKLKLIFNVLFFLYLFIVFSSVETGLTESMDALMSLLSLLTLLYFSWIFLINLIDYFYYDE